MRSLHAILVPSLLALICAPGALARGPEGLVAHEWGTFTCVQNAEGRELGAINIDDEPVPDFVHDLSPYLLQPSFLTTDHWRMRMKGVPNTHPHVTLRLETPVIYFHLPEGVERPVAVNVRARFRGGWLTEFFPRADAEAPGIADRYPFGELEPSTVGSLEWKGLRIGARGPFPETTEHVWTVPREVDAEPLTAPNGESERYVFYRGVGNLRAPLRVLSTDGGRSFDIRANFGDVTCSRETRVRALWLVDVLRDGRVAFREIPGFAVTGDETRTLATVAAGFDSSDYDPSHLALLEKRMHAALRESGLYADEATAMLETWHRAYFESPGRRVFFTVPRAWTDHYLPLEIPGAERIERVMMGRIELITERQRRLLAGIASGPAPDPSWVEDIPKGEARERFFAGRIDFGDLGVEIPRHYRDYLALGRFRNALVVEEERRRPTPALTAFIDAYGLRPYRTPAPVTASASE